MRAIRLKKIAMVCLTILLFIGMVYGTGNFVAAEDFSYKTQDGISVGDRLEDGGVLPWPTVEEGNKIGASYVYIYQDVGRGGSELFLCLKQEENQAYTMPSIEELKKAFWLYMPEGEDFDHWEVMDICASVDDGHVTFFWKVLLVRTKSGGTGEPGETEKPGGSSETVDSEIPPVTQDTTIRNAGAYDLTAGTDYILDGPMHVEGDSSIYAHGIRFRVKESGNYTFQ